MPIGADLQGNVLYLAENRPEGVQFHEVPSEGLGPLLRKKEVRLNLPLEKIVLRYQPSDYPLDKKLLQELALSNLGTSHVGFLEAEEGERKLYLLAGTNEALSGAKFVPRFLSVALALELTDGILVWSDSVESFVLVMEQGFPRQVRAVPSPEALPGEAGRAVNYLRTKGTQEILLYVPEGLAEAHAHLLPEEAIRVYEQNPYLPALGALTNPLVLAPLEKEEGRRGERTLGYVLALTALLLVASDLYPLMRLQGERRALEGPYQEALRVLEEKKGLESEIQALEKELGTWRKIQQMRETRALPVLVGLAETTSGRASLTFLRYEALRNGIRVELQGKTKDLPAYLRSLESRGLTLLEEAVFKEGGAETRLTLRGARH